MAGITNTIKNHVILILLYIVYLINRLKVALGLIKMKYGIVGYYEHSGMVCSTFVHKKERLDALNEFDDFRSDDVLLCTYPKSGTHFTKDIIHSIHKEAGLSKRNVCSFDINPPKFMVLDYHNCNDSRLDVFSDIKSTPSPRLILTHLPWNMLPVKMRNANVKVILCTRNPKDLACSYYAFLRTMRMVESQFSWKEFVFSFIEGNVVNGSYLSYLKQRYPHRNKPNVLTVHYEDMKKDLEGNVRRIAEFLNIELTQEQIDRIVVANTFENKKKEVGKGHMMYRRGKSGAWRSDITVEQNEMLDEWIEREMVDMPDLKLRYD